MLQDRVILKHNDVFVATDVGGDIPAGDDTGLGLYRADTRFLSAFELRVGGRRPILLSHSVDRAYVATFQLVNPALEDARGPIPRQSVSIRRSRFVHQGMHERIGVQNCHRRAVELELELLFEADFADIFEVRGYHRQDGAGTYEEPAVGVDCLSLAYRGRDGVRRSTDVTFDPAGELTGRGARLSLRLEPQETRVLLVDVRPRIAGDLEEEGFHFDSAVAALERTYEAWNHSCTRYESDNELLDGGLLWRNQEDLRVLCDELPTGLFPTAGVPWYAVPFGRDALVTSWQVLGLNPDIARGSLRYLAERQGRAVDPAREEEPGKILHELRFGELAGLREIPHTPYYGTVDATPLFLVLLVELIDWTGDTALLAQLEPHANAALEWIDRYGDLDGDGLVEYARHGEHGVRNQGWKDSIDSLLLADGTPAPLPAALVEVQGYVYHARAGLARIRRRLGRHTEAERLEASARRLREAFDRLFWMPAAGFFAQALDGGKSQVPAVSSNPGHCLWSGILEPARAARVVERLVAPDMFSGWGVRTLSSDEPAFNPMSYHNGSVWPHDNSIIAAGMRKYGHREAAELVARSVIEAAMRFPDQRVPELYCGFTRDDRFSSPPGEYLVSCSPQAWGTGALFSFLRTLAGVEVDALAGRLRIDPLDTRLYRRLRVEGMRVGDGELDFTVDLRDGVRVQVDRRPAGFGLLELPS